MDSTVTIIQHIVIDTLSFDSLNYKLMALHDMVSKQPTNPTYSIWIPFLSALVGGLLVLAGQSIDRGRKRKLETENSLREIYAYSRKLEAVMKNNYRELAMAKCHVEYWWYCHVTTDGSDKGRYYEEHLRSQALAREVERKI